MHYYLGGYLHNPLILLVSKLAITLPHCQRNTSLLFFTHVSCLIVMCISDYAPHCLSLDWFPPFFLEDPSMGTEF